MLKLLLNELHRGAEFCWGVIVTVHRDVVIDAAASLFFLQSKAGEGHFSNMVLGNRNLPDSLLVERVCPIVGIFCLCAVISIQVIDTAWVGQEICLILPGVSGILHSVIVDATVGGGGEGGEVNCMGLPASVCTTSLN